MLVVEDEPEITYLVRMMLERAGYSVTEALNAIEAAEKLRREKVDLVLLDIILPGKDGWGLLEDMKGNDELKDIPVIIFTAKVVDRRDRKYIKNYQLPVVTKPFECSTLIRTIAQGVDAVEA